MKDSDTPTLGYLKSEYVLVTRGRLWAFLGGAVGFAVTVGFISYSAALQAVKTTAAQQLLAALTAMESRARTNLVPSIESNLNEAEQVVGRIREVSGDLQLVQTGTLGLSNSGSHSLPQVSHLWDHNRQEGMHSFEGHVDFARPFTEVPQVAVGMNLLDAVDGENTRVRLNVTEVTNEGFKYEASTWHASRVWAVRADWIAIGQ